MTLLRQPVLKESEIQKQIVDYLKATRWLVIRNQQNIGSHKGLSDLTALRDGRVLFIEVKGPRGVQSDHQERFQREVEAHGGQYVLARRLEDVWEAIGER